MVNVPLVIAKTQTQVHGMQQEYQKLQASLRARATPATTDKTECARSARLASSRHSAATTRASFARKVQQVPSNTKTCPASYRATIARLTPSPWLIVQSVHATLGTSK